MFPCTASDGSVRALLEATDVDSVWREIQAGEPRWATDAFGSRHLVRFCDSGLDRSMRCAQNNPERVIFYAHRCCWKIANVPVLNDPGVLLRFAFQTRPFENRPFFHPWQVFHALDDPPKEPPPPLFNLGTNDLLPLDDHLFDDSTELGKLISRLGRMPLEIQFQVTKRLSLTLFLSLLKTKTLLDQLLPLVRESTMTKPQVRIPDTDGSFNSIHVRYRNIMGTSYLATIGFKRRSGAEAVSIAVANRNVRGVQFSLGRFGLKGIRVLYKDGTCSPWLGEPSLCWIGFAYGRDLSRLRVIADVCLCSAGPRSDATSPPQPGFPKKEETQGKCCGIPYLFILSSRPYALSGLISWTI